jgi:hypothetical protein
MEHFIVDESDGPKVRLVGVFDFLEQLRRHVKRGTNDGLHDGVVVL